jgi:phage terminase large subunit
MWFDATKCEAGINALKSYVYDYNDKKKTRSNEPKHDWASHTSDALRYL